MIKILVTGGFGLIGLETIKQLRAMHPTKTIVVADRREKLDELLSTDTYSQNYVGHVMRTLALVDDIISPDDALFETNFSGGIIHLGACVDTMAPASVLMEKNVEYTKKLLKAHRDVPFVFASSAATYGVSTVPNNPYGLSKKITENLLEARRSSAVLRFFNVYGPYEHHKGRMTSMPHRAARAYLEGFTYDLFDIEASRDFVHVSDVARACVGALHRLSTGAHQLTFDVGTGVSTSFSDMDQIVKTTFQMLNSRAKTVPFPEGLRGRYQLYTRAGVHAKNMLSDTIKLADGIEMLKKELEK